MQVVWFRARVHVVWFRARVQVVWFCARVCRLFGSMGVCTLVPFVGNTQKQDARASCFLAFRSKIRPYKAPYDVLVVALLDPRHPGPYIRLIGLYSKPYSKPYRAL